MRFNILLIIPLLGLAQAVPDPVRREAIASLHENFRGKLKVLAPNEIGKRQDPGSVCSPEYTGAGDGGNCPSNQWCSCAIYTPSFNGGGGYTYYVCDSDENGSGCD